MSRHVQYLTTPVAFVYYSRHIVRGCDRRRGSICYFGGALRQGANSASPPRDYLRLGWFVVSQM